MRSGGVKMHLQNSKGKTEWRAAAYEGGDTGEDTRGSLDITQQLIGG